MDKFIGKTLNDRYILTEIIGVGGMAIVYKAFDRVVNRVVAVKILKEEFMSDAQFRRRFTNESRAITMLSQNNIVDVYRAWDDEDAQTITCFGIGKVDSQKKFEMEVGFWIIENNFLG